MDTYASVSKYLAKRKAHYEKMSDSPIAAERNTAKRMISRIDNRTDELFNIQEAEKSLSGIDNKPVMGAGGPLYDDPPFYHNPNEIIGYTSPPNNIAHRRNNNAAISMGEASLFDYIPDKIKSLGTVLTQPLRLVGMAPEQIWESMQTEEGLLSAAAPGMMGRIGGYRNIAGNYGKYKQAFSEARQSVKNTRGPLSRMSALTTTEKVVTKTNPAEQFIPRQVVPARDYMGPNATGSTPRSNKTISYSPSNASSENTIFWDDAMNSFGRRPKTSLMRVESPGLPGKTSGPNWVYGARDAQGVPPNLQMQRFTGDGRPIVDITDMQRVPKKSWNWENSKAFKYAMGTAGIGALGGIGVAAYEGARNNKKTNKPVVGGKPVAGTTPAGEESSAIRKMIDDAVQAGNPTNTEGSQETVIGSNPGNTANAQIPGTGSSSSTSDGNTAKKNPDFFSRAAREFLMNTPASISYKKSTPTELLANKLKKEALDGLKTESSDSSDTLKDFLQDMAPSVGTSLLEFGYNNQAINDMQAPNKPVYIPQVRLNKTMDTGADRNMISRMVRTRNLNAERYAPNSQAILSEVGNSTAKGVEEYGKVSQNAANYKSQMENAEASANSQVNYANTMLGNQYLESLNSFGNNKVAARANAVSNLLSKIKMSAAERSMKKNDLLKARLLSMNFAPEVSNELMKMIGQLKDEK